jgi:hypothetical protein
MSTRVCSYYVPYFLLLPFLYFFPSVAVAAIWARKVATGGTVDDASTFLVNNGNFGLFSFPL